MKYYHLKDMRISNGYETVTVKYEGDDKDSKSTRWSLTVSMVFTEYPLNNPCILLTGKAKYIGEKGTMANEVRLSFDLEDLHEFDLLHRRMMSLASYGQYGSQCFSMSALRTLERLDFGRAYEESPYRESVMARYGQRINRRRKAGKAGNPPKSRNKFLRRKHNGDNSTG